MVPPSGLTLAKGAEDYANWDTGQESKGSVQGSVSIIVDSEWVDNLDLDSRMPVVQEGECGQTYLLSTVNLSDTEKPRIPDLDSRL